MELALVKEKVNNMNYLIAVTSNDLLELKVKNINFLFPMENYSVGFPKTFFLEEIFEKDAFLFMNRILDSETIEHLKKDLQHLKSNIKGICFTDLGVIEIVKELGLSLQLIYMQNHNATNVVSINYYLEYVDSVLISTDITKEEILTILNGTKKPLVCPYFSRVEVMYSRRTLLTNYEENFGLEIQQEKNLLEPISCSNFLVVENQYGTVFYQEKFIDYREIIHPNIMFYYINPYGLDKKSVEDILNGQKKDALADSGFLYKETYYNLKEKEL